MEASWWQDWLKGKLGLDLMGGAMPSKSLIQFSTTGRVSSKPQKFISQCSGGCKDRATGRFSVVRAHILIGRLTFLDVSSSDREDKEALCGLFHKDANPIHEGFILMT